ncbi:GNAT family N-acetyltransferase [Actinocrispum wychmicini]|uniref:Putative N-acetyltransferase YhbS n=1 Tax=Actinocrispum wychmicini TaxID=1213861 RepID=A0A4R2IWG8_9PSEU|nr:GNAT family N-acetyltransferase [Actinocrispum wychmicini]TCO49884.1 putative N-acetyltransferase YhbS [Actinocrispum wychmicini]
MRREPEHHIRVAEPADAGEILTVQRAAYVSEAQLYGNPGFSALTESLDEVRAAVESGSVLVATMGARIVGAVRGIRDGQDCEVARLVVAPDMQRRGIAFDLIAAVERAHAAHVRRFRMHTGERSEANLRLYQRAGYVPYRTHAVSPTLSLVYLEKPTA